MILEIKQLIIIQKEKLNNKKSYYKEFKAQINLRNKNNNKDFRNNKKFNIDYLIIVYQRKNRTN